jgi:hypothetical protein
MPNSARAFSNDFDPEAFDVEWFDQAPGQRANWTAKSQQSEAWAPKVPQPETWTQTYDE